MLKKAVRQGYSQMHEATEYHLSDGRRDGEPTKSCSKSYAVLRVSRLIATPQSSRHRPPPRGRPVGRPLHRETLSSTPAMRFSTGRSHAHE